MLRSLLIKLSMLGVTLGALIWIGMMMPLRQAMPPPAPPVVAAAPPVPVPELSHPASHPAMESAQVSTPAGAEKQDEAPAQEEPARPTRAASTQQPAESPATPRTSESRRVDLNRATVAELEGLPGIGPKLAQRVVDHRTSRGPFHKVEDLQQVKGIGRKKFDRLRPFVLVTNTKVPSRR
jgi:competence protein ComEA